MKLQLFVMGTRIVREQEMSELARLFAKFKSSDSEAVEQARKEEIAELVRLTSALSPPASKAF